jgi:hypothetical protein
MEVRSGDRIGLKSLSPSAEFFPSSSSVTVLVVVAQITLRRCFGFSHKIALHFPTMPRRSNRNCVNVSPEVGPPPEAPLVP